DLRTGRVRALITHFGDEEILSPGIGAGRETLLASVRRSHLGSLEVPVGNVVALHPGAEVTIGHVVLDGAGSDTVPAPNALGDVHQHAPPVLRHDIVGRGFGSSGQHKFPGRSRRGQKEQKMAPADHDFFPAFCGFSPGVSAGLWGWWQLLQGTSPMWSLVATWGKALGLARLASWHR